MATDSFLKIKTFPIATEGRCGLVFGWYSERPLVRLLLPVRNIFIHIIVFHRVRGPHAGKWAALFAVNRLAPPV